jgi:hypothetical protein
MENAIDSFRKSAMLAASRIGGAVRGHLHAEGINDPLDGDLDVGRS